MAPQKASTNSRFFFLCGAYSLYTWNSILNLNGYFEERLEDPSISKIYTFVNMFFGNLAILVSMYLSIKTNTMKMTKIFFVLIYFFFHLIYIVAEFVPSK